MYKLVMNVYHWPDPTTRRRDSSSDARAEPTATQYRSRHQENTTSLCDRLDNWNINVKKIKSISPFPKHQHPTEISATLSIKQLIRVEGPGKKMVEE